MTLRTLTYRWYDWQHRDDPEVNQRIKAIDALPPLPEAERMTTRPARVIVKRVRLTFDEMGERA